MPLRQPVDSLDQLCCQQLLRQLLGRADRDGSDGEGDVGVGGGGGDMPVQQSIRVSGQSVCDIRSAMALCLHWTNKLPPAMSSRLGDALTELAMTLSGGGGGARISGALHAVGAYVLGASSTQLTVEDIVQLSAVLNSRLGTVEAPPSGGPRKLTVTACRLQYDDNCGASPSPLAAAFDQVFRSFFRLEQVSLLMCASNATLASLAAHCVHLTHLSVDIATVDDSGVCALLGLASPRSSSCPATSSASTLENDIVGQWLMFVRNRGIYKNMERQPPQLLARHLPVLRNIRLESTLVSVRGAALLLAALPQLHTCSVSDVHICNVLDILFAVASPPSPPSSSRSSLFGSSDLLFTRLGNASGATNNYSLIIGGGRHQLASSWPLQLRELECRLPLDSDQAETMSRCCRHVWRLCLRGRRSQRQDTSVLQWFFGLGALRSVELIHFHPNPIIDSFLPRIGSQLTCLTLVEGLVPDPAAADTHRFSLTTLYMVLTLCWQLDTLSLGLCDELPPPPPVSGAATYWPPSEYIARRLRTVTLEGWWNVALLHWLRDCAPFCCSLSLSGHAGGLTDEQCLETLIARPFAQLRRLEMTWCRLTEPTVDVLIASNTNLEYIGHLRATVADWLRQKAAQSNWLLHVT